MDLASRLAQLEEVIRDAKSMARPTTRQLLAGTAADEVASLPSNSGAAGVCVEEHQQQDLAPDGQVRADDRGDRREVRERRGQLNGGDRDAQHGARPAVGVTR